MKQTDLFCLAEEIKDREFVLATYYIQLPKAANVMEKASSLAIGQTIGTWVEVPGITDEMRAEHMGKIVRILQAPSVDLSTQVDTDIVSYFFQIAYPMINFGAQIPMLLTTLLGNDASTSAQVKLVDIQLPEKFMDGFKGPNFGIEGLRNLTGVKDRPFILNMIKPCTGHSPEIGAKIFYETALGGVDFIKDDELLGNPDFSPAVERVKSYNKAAKMVYEKTGHETIYIVNATEDASCIEGHIQNLVEAGAKAIMLNFATIGYSLLQKIAADCPVPILGHYAGAGLMYEGVNSGMGSDIAIGKLPRLCGADIVMMNTPYGGYPLQYHKYIMTAQQLSLPLKNLRRSLPAVGGGVHPGVVEQYIKDLGMDIMLSPGGAIQGHPMGPAAGIRAMHQAIDYVRKGMTIESAIKEYPELNAAIERFGYRKAV
ncbi:RuBisCO large subunit C-terminal-like domain-containing protein [Anaerobium acetethylicum]|uniref:2,3-diketo-5-methylthiopentyl-1-phosphate enolase n=1 Tax=Anaerobium acetethylicum TaxID=1619234 RepID=A0A1D3TX87_9FIRM|nr:RuBisCO large subunit C-terminal-like domain-containing protein [Anaerobium acetethylicum]SCP98940.1 2,3-diketo-5-methylthiopentyl-1-phosphate enolase [Anaerobium acetethylicum]